MQIGGEGSGNMVLEKNQKKHFSMPFYLNIWNNPNDH
jgi:hypothetical protein